ncbi:DUF2252 family protein [Geomicrobium sp. JCM 19055]|uniref:DUF2252 family protein n=1 Tax=Geomicrobium sp. JCM 19055 TaxID=1460649 RepID=UPI0005A704B9|nr:DUF2252 family protein [Geomicrobium sp. JCM 19055]
MASVFLLVGLSTTDLADAEELNLKEAIPDEALRDAIKASLETEESIIDEATLEQLVELDGARGQGIADLTGLEYFTNLEDIELRSNEITDLGPLQQLDNLESIDLRQNHIRDLAALEGLTGLLNLDLRGNAVSDLSALKSLVHLETLDLRQNQITSIEPLAGLYHLEELNLRENSVHNLQPLQQLVELKELNLHTNRVNDLNPISNLEKLEVLTLRRNQVTDLSPLQSLLNLNDMNLRDNDIDSLEPLASLPRLTERLHVRGNDRLTDYSPVESYYANIKDVDFILRPLMPFPLERFDTQTSAERQRSIYESLVRNNSHFKDESIFEQKFQTMNTGMFSFFRGSSHLYADDALRGNMGVPDAWLKDDVNTWITGDFHVENIGFYGNGSGEPVFDFNDFDEVVYAPFYYDLIRYGSSLIKLNDIAPGLQLSDDEISEVITEFVTTYTNHLQKVADGEIEPKQFSFTPEHTEGFVKETAEELQSISQLDELNTWTTMIGEQRRFEEDNPRLAAASEAEKTMINTYWQNYVDAQTNVYDLDEKHFEIKDIVRRTNAGLGSLGYDRYYVLIEDASDSEDDDIILDVKAQTKAPFEEEASMQTPHAERTITGAKALLPDNHSPYWGMLDTEEQSYSVRERSRYKEEFGEASFESKEQLESVVRHSAQAAAIAHSRANPTFAENASRAIQSWEDFEGTLTEISVQYYGQVIHDYNVFSAQYTNGFFLLEIRMFQRY